MYCNRGSLAAEETVLQYSLVGSRFVLQYKLYCEPGIGLCRNTARARQLGARLGTQTGAGARSRRAGRAGVQARGALVTGPNPDTPPGFPGWSRLVEFQCTIPRECTKETPPKRDVNVCSTTIPQLYRKIHNRPIQM